MPRRNHGGSCKQASKRFRGLHQMHKRKRKRMTAGKKAKIRLISKARAGKIFDVLYAAAQENPLGVPSTV